MYPLLRRLPICLISAAALLSGCSQQDVFQGGLAKDAKVTDYTRSAALLESLPRAKVKIPVATYSFDDQTGQFKPNSTIAVYSSAVTKGGLAILDDALLEAGNHGWFTVIERGGLKNLLQERQVIRAMREEYRLPSGGRLPGAQPLYTAAFVVEGGIIGYDSDTVTGGLAASYFGVGGDTQYRSDTVDVYLRLVNVQSGEVLLSVNSSKTIYSMQLQANVFKYLTIDRILQVDTGITLNEPVNLAVRQAIETAVYSLVMEGASQGLWTFADPVAGQRALDAYLERKAADEEVNPEDLRRQIPGQQPMPIPAAPAPVPPATASHEAEPEMNGIPPLAPVTPVVVPPPHQPAELPVAQPDGVAPSSSIRTDQATTASTLQPVTPESPAQALPANHSSESYTGDPASLVKYLNDSRYSNRNAPSCRTDASGRCVP